MTVFTTAGAKIHISTVARASTVVDLATYAALTYTEVKEVQNLGELGDEAATVTFLSVGDSRTRKLKGSRDAGTMTVVCGRDPLDPGQLAMRAAEGTKFEYAFKVTLADAADANDTSSTYYFGALVGSRREGLGGADDVTTITFALLINTEIIEDLSEAVA